jgi:hypothetical protein
MSKTPQPSVNLKLSEELKQKINIRANFKNQTVSKYLRELLTNYFDGTLCIGEIEKNEKKEFINSTEFLQLIVWIYSKQKKSDFKESDKDLDGYIKTLKKVVIYLPEDLVQEFDKILMDILRVKNEESKYSKDYRFVNGYSSSPKFNFQLFEEFIFRYEKPVDIEVVREYMRSGKK